MRGTVLGVTRLFSRFSAALVAAGLLFLLGPAESVSRAEGLHSMGNTDGVLTWALGDLEPGESAREAVIFAYSESPETIHDALANARRGFARLPLDVGSGTASASPALGDLEGENAAPAVWIENGTTDFALDPHGAFFWEHATRQSLRSERGGQLSRFAYVIQYNDGAARSAGTRVWKRGDLDNLRIIEPVRIIAPGQIAGTLETDDRKLRLRVRAVVGEGRAAAVEFLLTNACASHLSDVRLSAYSNLESANTHEGDYSVLDPRLGGLLVVDPPTSTSVVMAGLDLPATGYSGAWASEQQLRAGAGVPIGEWKPFTGIPKDTRERLMRAAIPHAPAPPVADPETPETRTLTEIEATEILEKDWLFQADGELLNGRALKEIDWARALAERLRKDPRTPDLAGDLKDLSALKHKAGGAPVKAGSPRSDDSAKSARDLYLAVRRVKRRIAFKNPVIDFGGVLVIDNPYPQGSEWPHQARHRDGMMAVPGGRLLVLDGLRPGGKVTALAPVEDFGLPRSGSFWRADLSFDAGKVLFCYKAHDEKSFHLYEINIDGSGLRQLTFGDYDDLDPIYLPDGHILFTSTRGNTYIRCMPYTYCYILARCDADGQNVYILSQNNECDWLPTLLNDGRVAYSRWEYHDKALWRIQSLWAMNPDGTNVATFWGNQSVWPDHLAEPRPVPGSVRVMFTGTAHHDWFAGSIGILDTRKGFNFPLGLSKVTADVPWPECGEPPLDPIESPDYHTSGRYDAYKTPYPLGEEDFLVSARREGKFRLYLMDVRGNRELIYQGAHQVWHAIPVKRRERPPVLTDRVAWPGTGGNRETPQPGVLYSANVCQGAPDILRGKAKHLRVIQMDARTYSTWTRDARFSGPGVSLVQDDGVKRILGTTPVEADGSVHFKAPPGKALHFQLLDERYRALHTMRSFTGAMPGERRGCVGCHELHSTTPVNETGRRGLALALRREAADLTPPPWGTASIGYERFVQPVLDQHCGWCHQGDGEGRKKLDLTLRPGLSIFKEPYITLVGGAQYSPVPPTGKPGIAGAIMCENFAQSDPASYATFPPMQHLSYTSKLIEIAMSGKHNNVKVDPLGLQKLIAWVDTNCPYRGEPEIRAIPDPDFPGIEALPIRPRTRTAPVVERP